MWLVALLVQLEADLLRTYPEDNPGGPFGLVVKVGDAALALACRSWRWSSRLTGGWARAGRLLLLLASAACVPLGWAPGSASSPGCPARHRCRGAAIGPPLVTRGLRPD
jgi:hypothetical protein